MTEQKEKILWTADEISEENLIYEKMDNNKQFLDAEKVKEIIDNSEFTNIIIQRLSPNQIMDEIKLYLLNRLGG